MRGKIKYLIELLVLLLIGTGLYLFIQHIQKKEKKDYEKGEDVVSFEEKLLAVLPTDVKEEDMNSHVFSPDGRSVAYILRKGKKLAVVVNYSISPEYDDVGPPQFSPDGKVVAYKAKIDSSWIMIIGDKKSEKFDDIDYPLFSPDGKRIAYSAKERNKWFIIIDGKRNEGYDKVQAVSFSPDSKRFAYRGILETEKKALIVVDDKKKEKYDWVTDPQFSPDGKRVAYTAKEGDKWFMIADDRKSQEYDAVGIPIFSTDGKRFAYAVRIGGKSFIVVDDKKIGPYDGVWNPCFSPDSKRIAYTAKEGNRWFMVVDNKKSDPYEDLSNSDPSSVMLSRIRQGMPVNIPFSKPCFSPDSKKIGYYVKEGSKSFTVIDDKKSEKYDEVSIPYFSQDGTGIAYGVKEGDKWFIIADNEKYSAFYGILPKEVPIDEYHIKVTRENVIVFSTSLKKTAYICLTPKGYSVAVNGNIGGEYDLIGGAAVNNGLGIVFRIRPSDGKLMLTGLEHLGTSILTFGNEYSGSPYLHLSHDMKKVAFGARKGRELWWKVIDLDQK